MSCVVVWWPRASGVDGLRGKVCIYLYVEADTGPQKAHEHSWGDKGREGPLAYTMGFRASPSGQGRAEPWLKEKREMAEKAAKKAKEEQEKAGSPSPRQKTPEGRAAVRGPPPKGTVALQMRVRSPSPNKIRSSKWAQAAQQPQSSASGGNPKKSIESGPGG